MSEVKIVMHSAHLGAVDGESVIETAMRLIGTAFGDEGDWCDKYGCNYENDVFLMHRYCWCDRDDGSCLWCIHGDNPDFDRLLAEKFGPADYQRHRDRHYYDPPQFWYKPTDYRLSWYKYIGRDMASNKDDMPNDFLRKIFETHPTGMSIEQAVDLLAKRTEDTRASFQKILDAAFSRPSPTEDGGGNIN